MESRKRQCLTFAKKCEIIRVIESGKSQASVCREFNLSKSTVGTIWAKRERLLQSAYKEDLSLSRKRLRTAEHCNVEEALIKWFQIQRSNNIPINGPLLQAKAEDFAKEFNILDFKCSTGWLDRFKVRHGLVFGKISGEKASVDRTVTENWKAEVWSREIENYSPRDIYNADETGIFYRLTPDKTFRFRGESSSGGKKSKERITVLVCANMDGSDKRKLLIIGKFKNPRCFKNVRSLPVNYQANSKAWMTSDIFKNELVSWDRDLIKQKRKILLLVDNCPAHPDVKNLKCIKLLFLPANATSELQPMDQGIIRCLKHHFGRFLVLHLIRQIEDKQNIIVSLLDAIGMIHRAWMCIKSETIFNCYKHAGLVIEREVELNIYDDNDDDLPLSEWIKQNNVSHFDNETIEDFEIALHDNENVIVTETPTDGDIVSSILNSEVTEENENSVENEANLSCSIQIPSTTEAISMAEGLSRFIQSINDVPTSVLNSLAEIKTFVETSGFQKKMVQTKISNFFRS